MKNSQLKETQIRVLFQTVVEEGVAMVGNLRDDEHGGGGRHLELPQAGAQLAEVAQSTREVPRRESWPSKAGAARSCCLSHLLSWHEAEALQQHCSLRKAAGML